jgi:hypothetical protein
MFTLEVFVLYVNANSKIVVMNIETNYSTLARRVPQITSSSLL